MALRPVFVCHMQFQYNGEMIMPGKAFDAPDDIAFMRANHPEKGVMSSHDFPDPAPVVAPAQARASDGE